MIVIILDMILILIKMWIKFSSPVQRSRLESAASMLGTLPFISGWYNVYESEFLLNFIIFRYFSQSPSSLPGDLALSPKETEVHPRKTKLSEVLMQQTTKITCRVVGCSSLAKSPEMMASLVA